MARNKFRSVYLVVGLLVSSFAFQEQIYKVKEDEKNFIVFPRAFFISNADQMKMFLSSNVIIENATPKQVMTSAPDSSQSSISFDESTTSLSVQDTTSLVSCEGRSIEPTSVSECRGPWYHWDTSYYAFVSTSRLTWPEAMNACSSMCEGAYLVFIESDQENRRVSCLAVTVSGQYANWWIGLDDKDTEGIWKWNNITVSYTNWYDGEPNSFGGTEEDCVMFWKWDGNNARWNDEPCSRKNYFICEKDM